jgi:hypothetical protein
VTEVARRFGCPKAGSGPSRRVSRSTIVRRGSRPGVDWTTVEAHIARSRVIRVNESLRPNPDPGRPGGPPRSGQGPVRLVRPPARPCPRRDPDGGSPLPARRRTRPPGVPSAPAVPVAPRSSGRLRSAAAPSLTRGLGVCRSNCLAGGVPELRPIRLRWPDRPRTGRRWCSRSDVSGASRGTAIGLVSSRANDLESPADSGTATRLFVTPRFKERSPPVGAFFHFWLFACQLPCLPRQG